VLKRCSVRVAKAKFPSSVYLETADHPQRTSHISASNELGIKGLASIPLKGISMSSNNGNGVPPSRELDKALEAAVNYLYLIRTDCEDSEKVCELVVLAESNLQRMATIISGNSAS
jgi:hypothetical protein